ncbi:hypothetical protein Y10_26500 [Neptunitalea sp. Y10]|uniref:Lipoprotein n=1 Tax=Neptunitalea lumnitzerae TaxID=2965509 RepID=A0ABQ5MLK2_9FLAO|nr:hypothetical protein Y10_26500 [Neptunitalea sp. Y10]
MYVVTLLITLGMFTACSDSDDASGSINQEEAAAETIINAMSPETGGAITQTDEAVVKASTIEDAAKQTDEPTISCGVAYANEVTLAGTQGGVTYYVGADWNWMLSCTVFGVPETFTMSFSSSRQYTSNRMTSDDDSVGEIAVSGLELLSNVFVVNSEVINSGNQISTLGNGYDLNSTINITISNLTYDKATLEILSGSANVSFSGTFNGTSSEIYGGTVEFLGSKNAVLNMNNGNSYPFSW